MNYEETARHLIEGSRAINKMREEVELLVPMVISMLPESVWWQAEADYICESETVRWVFSVRAGQGGSKRLQANCYTTTEPGAPKIRHAYYSSGGAIFSSHDVQAVHESLPLFLKGIMDNYPTANKDWHVFIEAAKKGVV